VAEFARSAREMVRALSDAAPPAPPAYRVRNRSAAIHERAAVVLPLTDLHYEMLDWRGLGMDETDRRLWHVVDRFLGVLHHLVDEVEELHLWVGSDWWDVNGRASTTERGTPQHIAAPHRQTVRRASRALVQVIERARQRSRKVVLHPVPGNHYPDLTTSAIVWLELLYEDAPDVEFAGSILDGPTWTIWRYEDHAWLTDHGEMPQRHHVDLLQSEVLLRRWPVSTLSAFYGHTHQKCVQ
jgi:hypothetical protein